MHKILLCFVVAFFIFSLYSFAEENIVVPRPWGKEDETQRKMVFDFLRNSIDNPLKCIDEITRLEKRVSDFPYVYTKTMDTVVAMLTQHKDDPRILDFTKMLARRVTFFSLKDSELDSWRRIEFEREQIGILMRYPMRLKKSADLSDCDAVERRARVSRVLDLYFRAVVLIDDSYDPDAQENIIIQGGFVPPDTFEGPIVYSGIDYLQSTDPATREAFKAYREEENKKLNYRSLQSAVHTTKVLFESRLSDYMIDAYSLFPYHTEELEQMLTERKVDPEMTKTILDAVRKAEQEFPDEGFRIWLSKDKLFKVTAKFVSLNEDLVTLERADGKEINIELSVLRMEDQEYIRRLTKPAPEMHTWRSAGGEYEIKATFVSGDETIIVLKREDGVVIRVEVALLSAEDQEYVKQRLEAEQEKNAESLTKP